MRKKSRTAIQLAMAAALGLAPVCSSAVLAEEPFEDVQTESLGAAMKKLAGQPNENHLSSYYSNWAKPAGSYLFADGDGFCRVDRRYIAGDTIEIERYNGSGELMSTKSVSLPFGGQTILGTVARTGTGYYVVTGQSNQEENDSKLVVCIEKYDFNWNKILSQSISDLNTTEPFDFGDCAVDEAGGYVRILTCHRMYKSSDGLNHQASMAFLLDAGTLEVVDKMCLVESQSLYVAHSFSQRLRSNGQYSYAVQLGDAYPRAIVLTRTPVNSLSGEREQILSIKGSIGDNKTGVSLTGFELSDGYCLSAGTSIDQSEANTDLSTRNVFVISTDQNTMKNSQLKWVTSYTAADNVQVYGVKLVKMSGNSFKLLWNEARGSSVQSKVADLDGSGNMTSAITTFSNGRVELTECEPVVLNGVVSWIDSTFSDARLAYLAEGVEMTVPMHRLYNPNSGEHFYTADDDERNGLVQLGWKYEGTGWNAPETSSTPVYRLYNANAGDHHYTMSEEEKNALVSVGWKYEGIGWYSDDAKEVPLYRQYNPNAKAGSHNYTVDKTENDALVALGWKAEGIGWYGLK